MKIILGSERMRALKTAKEVRAKRYEEMEDARYHLKACVERHREAEENVTAACDAIALATDPE